VIGRRGGPRIFGPNPEILLCVRVTEAVLGTERGRDTLLVLGLLGILAEERYLGTIGRAELLLSR
jgi:hypothetical protein